MFDISWGKLVIIGVVALVVIGPKELPAVLRMAGQWVGKMRRMAAEFQGQFQEAMREAEMADLKKSFDDAASSVKSTFDPTSFKTDVENFMNVPEPTTSSSAPATPAAEAAAAPADSVAVTPAPATGTVTAEPQVDVAVPMPDPPPPVTEKDIAPPPATATPTEAPAAETGGGKAA